MNAEWTGNCQQTVSYRYKHPSHRVQNRRLAHAGSNKAMLHRVIFLANLCCNKRCVASCKKDFTCITPHFCNLQCNKMLQGKYDYPQLFTVLQDKFLRVTCQSQLATLVFCCGRFKLAARFSFKDLTSEQHRTN